MQRWKPALGIAQAKEAELAQARLLLATTVARTYFRLVAAAEGQRLRQAMLDLQRQHLDIDQLERDFTARVPAAVSRFYDAALTRDELKGSFEKWFTEWDKQKSGSLDEDQVRDGLNAVLPRPQFGASGGPGGPVPGRRPSSASRRSTCRDLRVTASTT